MKLNPLDALSSLKTCPECGNITCFLLPRFIWKDGLIECDENGTALYDKKVCPKCVNKNEVR